MRVDMALDGVYSEASARYRPPGHHALRDRAMGFCLWAMSPLPLDTRGSGRGADRILIVDWDVHHGTGCKRSIEDDAGSARIDHQWPWFPGPVPPMTGTDMGRCGTCRCPWACPRRTTRAHLLQAVDQATIDSRPISFSCRLASIRSGRSLGGFTLELSDIDLLTRELVQRSTAWCGGRLVSALEGGYAVDRTAAACVAHLRAML